MPAFPVRKSQNPLRLKHGYLNALPHYVMKRAVRKNVEIFCPLCAPKHLGPLAKIKLNALRVPCELQTCLTHKIWYLPFKTYG